MSASFIVKYLLNPSEVLSILIDPGYLIVK